MITTLAHRLINVPARLIRHAGRLILPLPPGHDLLAQVLARIRALPNTALTRPNRPQPSTGTRTPEATLGPPPRAHSHPHPEEHQLHTIKIHPPATRGFGSENHRAVALGQFLLQEPP